MLTLLKMYRLRAGNRVLQSAYISSVIHEQRNLNISCGICTAPGSMSKIHIDSTGIADSTIAQNKCIIVSYHTKVGYLPPYHISIDRLRKD